MAAALLEAEKELPAELGQLISEFEEGLEEEEEKEKIKIAL